MTPRAALLDLLARSIAGRPGTGFVRVGIDGVDGAGKSTFAAELAAAVAAQGRPVVSSTVDGFHRPRAQRYRQGRDSPDGYYEDSYDHAALRRCLLDPFGPGGDGRFRRAAFDHRRDAPVDAALERAAPGTVLVVDGIFLHRPELRDAWDVSVFLRVDVAEAYARMAVRDDCPADPLAPENRRYLLGQRRYLRECRPMAYATVVVDNTDLAAPYVVTSCAPSGMTAPPG